MSNGSTELFDYAILATHANQSLKLLGKDASILQREILSSFTVSTNTCVLHSDASVRVTNFSLKARADLLFQLLPSSPLAQSAWNCMIQSSPEERDRRNGLRTKKLGTPETSERRADSRHGQISLTFDMNKLQHIPLSSDQAQRALVSMNPIHQPRTSTIQGTFTYDHPQFTARSMRAESRLSEINGVKRIGFAGAWMGYGFHEDGFVSGLQAANMLLPAEERVSILPPHKTGAERGGKQSSNLTCDSGRRLSARLRTISAYVGGLSLQLWPLFLVFSLTITVRLKLLK